MKVGTKRDLLLLERAGHRFNQLKLAYDLLSTCNGSRILDVGCGQGLLEEYFQDRHCVGMDIDLASVSAARKRAPQGQYLCGDIHNLAIKTGAADAVSMVAVLGSVLPGKEERVLNDVKRVLRPGGTLVILVSQDRQPYSLLVPDRLFGRWQWRHFDADFLQNQLRSAGFSVQKVVFAGGLICLGLDLFHYVWNALWRLSGFKILGRPLAPGLPYRKLGRVESLEFRPFPGKLQRFARYIYVVAERR